jgi:hypothetical protein
MNTDIEGIVEEFEKEFWDNGDERYGWVKHNNTIVQRQIDWLRTTLQSQADKYEREIKELHDKAIHYPMRGTDGVADYKYNMGYLDAIKTIAQKYGVDLSK